MPDGRKVVLNGNAVDLRGREKGVLPVGAFGLTTIAASGWVCVGITQQVRGPDLSSSPEPPTEQGQNSGEAS